MALVADGRADRGRARPCAPRYGDTVSCVNKRAPYRALTAGELAAELLVHPDAPVHLATPHMNAIIGTMHFGNDDGSMPDAPNGMTMLGFALPGEEQG
jgi:hypothetical protein